MPPEKYDLVSLGEVMLRLAPPRYERLRHARSLDITVAGSQLNVAANLARLGWRTTFLSKLPDNELGMLARDACQGYGVDMSQVHMVPGMRIGVNYLEHAVAPRVGVVIYDRARSAASTIGPDDFDWASILRGTRVAYTDGIMPGLSEGCRQAALSFLRAARERGCLTAFDLNYREHLWTGEGARQAWGEILPLVDVVVTNRSVSEEVFGYQGTDEEIMSSYAQDFGSRVVVFTTREMFGILRGAWSSHALHDGAVLKGRRYEFDVVDRIGTGDAFTAGFIYGYVEKGVQYGLDFGNALCAIAHTLEGDVAQVSLAEVQAMLRDDYSLRVR
ncbi:MAG TPA: sugar kinase, partial [Chloroflexia bacterium]|nr:sugar kinase [Chloroflexia bacterium]